MKLLLSTIPLTIFYHNDVEYYALLIMLALLQSEMICTKND